MQVVQGPRQVGKTTLVRRVLERSETPWHYATADEPTFKDREWIAVTWEAARAKAGAEGGILALDEIQKIPKWSETVKRLWDEDTRNGTPLQVILLGSAPLLVEQGLTESLAGRFEILRLGHWTYSEMQEAFGWSLDAFISCGGYPGAAPLINDPARWRRYILDSLIETSVSRDVLLLTRVDKPALLRRLFQLGSLYSGQILSYQKVLGQLQDGGNTVTLSHYLDLLDAAGLLTGLSKFSGSEVRQRGSSPKFQVLNNALMTAQLDGTPESVRADTAQWGRLVESCVGAYLVGEAKRGACELFYWRSRNLEVDFVLRAGDRVVAIEVKSSPTREAKLTGLKAFAKTFPTHRTLLVGGDGVPVGEFLQTPVETWFRD